MVNDSFKTKAQLIKELEAFRIRYGELKASYKMIEEEKLKYEHFIENVDESCFEIGLDGKSW